MKPDSLSLRFGWIIPGTLAGSAGPGLGGILENDLAWLRAQGLAAIASATEKSLRPDAVKRAGFFYTHLPVMDQRAPTHKQMDAFVAFVETNRPVLIHCAHGVGRTGTFAAAYIICAKHRTADQAIGYVAANRFGRGKSGPGVATRVQEASLRSYEQLCRAREK